MDKVDPGQPDLRSLLAKLTKARKDSPRMSSRDIAAGLATATDGQVQSEAELMDALAAQQQGRYHVWLLATHPDIAQSIGLKADVPITFHDIAQSAARGLSANFSDRLLAGYAHLTQGTPYPDALEQMRRQHEQFARAHPVSDFAASMAPLLALGPARAAFSEAAPMAVERTAASTIGKSVLVGGGYGGAAAAADSRETSLPGVLSDAARGATTGAVVAPALTTAAIPITAIGRGLGASLIDILRPAKGGVRRAIGKIAADMTDSRLQGVPGAQDYLREANTRAPGVPVVADASPLMRSSLRAAINASPVAREAAQEQLGARNADEAVRLSRSLEEKAGYPGGVHTRAEEILAKEVLSQEADPRYLQLSIDNPHVVTPEILKVLRNPAVRSLWTRAQELADADGLEPLTAVYDNAGNLAGRIPDFRTLNYIRKALNDRAEAGFNGSSSAGKQLAAAYRKQADLLTAELENNVPDFKATQEWYAEKKSQLAGYEQGRQAMRARKDPRDITRDLAKLSPAARETYRAGMFDETHRGLGEIASNVDVSRRMYNAGTSDRARLRMLFKTPADFEAFMQDVGHAADRRKTLNAVNNQSATNQNEQDAFQRSLPRELAGGVRHGERGFISGFIGGAQDILFGPAKRAAARKEAEILLSSGPKADAWLETLTKAQKAAERRSRIQDAVQTGLLPMMTGRSAADSTSLLGHLLFRPSRPE